MKKIVLFILLSVIFSLQLTAQSYSQLYAESLLVWEELKVEKGNTYSYRTTYSGMAGRTDVIINVKDGEVVKKTVEMYGHDEGSEPKVESYESTEDLKNNKTIDEIYEFTLTEVLPKKKKTRDYQIYFELNEDKLIAKTGYYPFACKDDCFVGYSITEINWE